MKYLLRVSLLAATVALLAPASQAQHFFAVLDGPSENPPNASPGTGFARVFLDPVGHTMQVQVSFSGLIGNVTNSHIHAAVDPPGNVGVATPVPTFPGFPGGGTSGVYNQTFDMTLASSYNPAFITNNGGTPATAEIALFNAIMQGRAYLNIHSTQFGGGEIRGFFQAVAPEPASLGLLGMGMGLGAIALRRRKSI